MNRYRSGFGTLGILLLLWAVPAPVKAQTPVPLPQNPQQKSPSPGSMPVEIDLNKIRNALAKDPLVRFDDVTMKFYVEVYGQQTRFWDSVGSFDFRNGPVPGAGMTHQEFLNQVAPKNAYFGPPTAKGVAMVAAGTAAFAGGSYLLTKLREALKHAKTDNERKRIQDQIDRELAALTAKK
jgi:hypothetical protein